MKRTPREGMTPLTRLLLTGRFMEFQVEALVDRGEGATLSSEDIGRLKTHLTAWTTMFDEYEASQRSVVTPIRVVRMN